MADYDVSTTQRGNDLWIVARRRSEVNWKIWKLDRVQVSARLTVPADVQLDLDTSGGSITVRGDRAERLKADTSGGGIRVDGGPGDMDLDTSGGSITVGRALGSLKADTSGGGISVQYVGPGRAIGRSRYVGRRHSCGGRSGRVACAVRRDERRRRPRRRAAVFGRRRRAVARARHDQRRSRPVEGQHERRWRDDRRRTPVADLSPSSGRTAAPEPDPVRARCEPADRTVGLSDARRPVRLRVRHDLSTSVPRRQARRARCPLTPEMLRARPSGDLFGLSQNAGMGWAPGEVGRTPFLILSTQGGLRAPDGTPIALGYHTGHWEIGLLVDAAARELKRLGAVPFAAYCSDPCDGRSQGTPGMFDSLPYRNDAAIVFRRLIRSLPVRARGARRRDLRQGSAGHDDGARRRARSAGRARAGRRHPATRTGRRRRSDSDDWRALRARADLAAGRRGSRLPGVRLAGRGCQFLGTAATSQVVGEALGLSLPHSALAPSGQPVWTDLAVRSARALRRSRRGTHDHRHPADVGERAQRHGRPRGVRRLHEPSACTCPRSRMPPACRGPPSKNGWP